MSSDPAGYDAVIELPATGHAPAIARQYLTDHATSLPPDLLDDALVLVSELVSNALQHGQPRIVLRLRSDPPGIGVAVQDAGPELPQAATQPRDPAATRGRGLLIVNALATDWGVRPSDPPPGKTVWFELVPPDANSR